jgi:hypothetical protein
MAPPSKLTPDLQERICQLIRAGNTHEIAAEATGVSARAFYNWKSTKPAFREAIERAEADAEAILVARISKAAAAGSWRAATWLLERRNPERWARTRPDMPEESDEFAELYEVGKPQKTDRAG